MFVILADTSVYQDRVVGHSGPRGHIHAGEGFDHIQRDDLGAAFGFLLEQLDEFVDGQGFVLEHKFNEAPGTLCVMGVEDGFQAWDAFERHTVGSMQQIRQADDGKITALYERLSKDDDFEGDSNSIVHQKEILETYAKKNGFSNIRHFVDDGVSGTLFKRPGLDALLDEVRAGRVATVIIKDQSRIGRDVLEVGLLKRTFDEFNVSNGSYRYRAVCLSSA